MSADTLTDVGVVIDVAAELDDGTGTPDEVAHYVDQRFEQDVAAAMVDGTEIVALCGHSWVPWRDPRRLPVCRPCAQRLYEILQGAAQ